MFNWSQLKRFLQFFWAIAAMVIPVHKAPLCAQEVYSERKYTIDNGLSHNQVVYVNQDTTGFLWIATWDGLNRYDGYQIQTYYHRTEDSTSFPGFSIEKVLVDKANHVIVDCGFFMPAVYDPEKNCFSILKINGMTCDNFDINVGIDRTVWAINDASLFEFDDSLKIKRTFEMTDQAGQKFSISRRPQLVIDNTDRPWVFLPMGDWYMVYKGTIVNDTLVRWSSVRNLETKTFTTFNIINDTENLEIQETANGETYLFSKFGLYLFDPGSESFSKVSGNPDPRLFSGKAAFFWGDGENGLNYIDTETDQVHQIKLKTNSFFETALKDRSGNIWAGIVTEKREDLGLFRYNLANPFFKHYLTGPDEHGDIRMIFSVFKDKQGNVWAGMRKDNFLYRVKPDGRISKMDYSYALNPETRVKPRILAGDTNGFWIAGTNDVLLLYDYQSQKFSTRFNQSIRDQNGGKEIGFHNTIVDRERILFNGFDGIFSYAKGSGILSQVFKVDPYGVQHSFMRANDGGYWIGIWNNSVIKLDKNFKLENTYKLGRENTLVEHVCPGDNDDLWLALMGGGLGHLYPATGKYEFFTTADGLSNNVLYSLLKDRHGNLWMSTNQGISMFNPRSKYFRRFGREEGLMIDEFNSDAWFQSEDGEMFFGGVGGVVSFYPDSLLFKNDYTKKSTLLITEFLASGRPVFLGNLQQGEVTLQKGDNNFQVTFALLDFQHSNRIKYRYRLLGANSDWLLCGFQNRRVMFDNLTHRDYTLQVEATDQQGEWAYSRTLIIHIPHRIIEATWFWMLSILVIGGIIFMVVLLLIRNRRAATRQLENNLRMESLRGQMNPHFIFNSLNSINYFISNNDKISANSFIADFSRLIRQTLENLSSSHVPLDTELSSISDYLKLEHLRFGDRFSYSIQTGAIDVLEKIEVVPGLAQPFIENAIWHGIRGLQGRTGTVTISFFPLRPDALECIIEDDGIGCRLSKKTRIDLPGKQSQGIRIVRDRLHLLSKTNGASYDVEIVDLHQGREEPGTRVRLLIPIKIDKK